MIDHIASSLHTLSTPIADTPQPVEPISALNTREPQKPALSQHLSNLREMDSNLEKFTVAIPPEVYSSKVASHSTSRRLLSKRDDSSFSNEIKRGDKSGVSQPLLIGEGSTQGAPAKTRFGKFLMAAGQLSLSSNREENSPLQLAVKGNDLKAVKSHLMGPDINAKNTKGQTALGIAMAEPGLKNRLELVKLLLTNPHIDTNLADKDGYTPLNRAAEKGLFHILAHVLTHHPDTNANLPDINGRTPLYHAAENDHTNAVKTLLACDRVDPNLHDVNGKTPANCAAEKGHLHPLNALLDARSLLGDPLVNFNFPNKDGVTPLGSAVKGKHLNVVKAILENNHVHSNRVDPNLADKHGYTPLNRAADMGLGTIVQFMLSDGHVDPNQPNKNGATPIHSAVHKNHPNIVKAMLANSRINPNTPDEKGFTPLISAVHDGRYAIVEDLLAKPGVDRNHQDKNGYTAIFHAVGMDYFHILKTLLLDAQVDPNITNHEGLTPLQHAVEHMSGADSLNRLDAIEVMLNSPKVDPNGALQMLENYPDAVAHMLRLSDRYPARLSGQGVYDHHIQMLKQWADFKPVVRGGVHNQALAARTNLLLGRWLLSTHPQNAVSRFTLALQQVINQPPRTPGIIKKYAMALLEAEQRNDAHFTLNGHRVSRHNVLALANGVISPETYRTGTRTHRQP